MESTNVLGSGTHNNNTSAGRYRFMGICGESMDTSSNSDDFYLSSYAEASRRKRANAQT